MVDMLQRLWNMTESLNILFPKKWMNECSAVLREFQRDIYEAVKDKGWDGSDEVNETNLQWTYAGSLLYSVTVITTIGQHVPSSLSNASCKIRMDEKY